MSLAKSAKLRIGCVYRDLSFPYWATFAQGIRAGAAEQAAELCLPQIDAEEDLEGAVYDVIRQRPDCAVLPFNVAARYPAGVEAFRAARIPVVGAETEPHESFVAVIHADETGGTRDVLKYLFEKMGGSGKLINIPGINPTRRQNAFQAMLREHPQIELVYEQPGIWSRESGREVMRAALEKHSDAQGVFAHNDHMALGALDVLAEHGLQDQMTVVGFDADPEGLIGIRQHRLSATVYRGLYHIGRNAVQIALQAARGKQVASEVRLPTTLITAENLIDAALDTVELLPGLLLDLVVSNQAHRRLQQETINAQRLLIQELSTPVIPISDEVLVMPLIGALDTRRAQEVMESMLHAVEEHRAQFMIVDITGISVVDTGIAYHLIQSARAVQLLGVRVLLVGISPEIAQTLVGLGINFGEITVRSTLQDGFAYTQRLLAAKR